MSTFAQDLTDEIRSMSLDIVTVRVDDPPVDVPVYKSLISHVAPYFRGAFDHAFQEADEGVICLSDVSESTFRIFLSWMHAQLLEGRTTSLDFGPDLSSISPSHSEKGFVDVSHGRSNSSLFDINGDQKIMHYDASEVKRLYYENPDWLAWYEATLNSLLLLYIFADKYSVHQLRDDIMSAMLGHVLAWNFWPEITHTNAINMAYEHLPCTAQFSRFLTLSVAYLWDGADDNASRKALAELPPSFLVDVTIAQARIIARVESVESISDALEEDIPNSCTFHEHIVRDEVQCRQRLVNGAHVFASIINTCSKEAEKTLAVRSSS